MDKLTINEDRVLCTFLELVQIDSPSKEEAAVAEYCKEALEAAGSEVSFDNSAEITGSNTGNLFATLPSFGMDKEEDLLPLYYSAHMDTVSPGRGVKPLIKDGVIYSDGTTILGGDDKVGVAAILELVRVLKEGEALGIAHPEIRVLFSVQEECGLAGAKAMDPSQFAQVQGALCYVLDAGGKPGLVVNSAPYQYTYRAQFCGCAAHAGIAPETGISAIRAAAKAIAALPQGRIDEQTTTNIGMIEGGTATNIVAADCSITGEIRSHDKEKLLALKARVNDILKAATNEELHGAGPASVDISWEVNYEGFAAPEDALQVQLALSAARALGLEASVAGSGGGADTNVLSHYGFAAVSLGCGMDQVHATNERLLIKDLYNLSKWAVQIALQAVCSLGSEQDISITK